MKIANLKHIKSEIISGFNRGVEDEIFIKYNIWIINVYL